MIFRGHMITIREGKKHSNVSMLLSELPERKMNDIDLIMLALLMIVHSAVVRFSKLVVPLLMGSFSRKQF